MEEQEKVIMSPENQYIEQMKLSKSKTLKEIISIVLVETIIIGILFMEQLQIMFKIDY